MKILLTGGTGFVGTALRESLTEKGNELIVLTRQSGRENHPGIRTRYVYWNPSEQGMWEKELDGVDAVVNLAGESIVGKRWSEGQKRKIRQSRTESTKALVEGIQKIRRKPSLFLNASAVGYYGPHGDEEITEDSPAGHDFLAETCKAWEAEALRIESLGIRTIRLRIGIVLEMGGGALAKMLTPFKLGLGGPLGTGAQWMSWIHRKDLIGLIHFLLEKKDVRGVYNGTAPHPVTMREFSGTLGRVLHRPAFFPVPGFVLKILLGEMADMLLTGQRVIPKRAITAGYSFKFPSLEPALKEILKK